MFRPLLILFSLLMVQNCLAQCPNITVSTTKSTYCYNDSVSVTAVGLPMGSISEWDYGQGYDTLGSNFSYLTSIYGHQNLNLRLTLASGTVCNYTFDSIATVIAPLNPSFTSSRLKLCNGKDTIQLIDETIGSANRNWVVNAQTFNNTADTAIVYVNGLGNIDITLIVDDSFGCRSLKYFYDTLQVYADIQLDFSNSNSGHCVPYSTSFTPTFINANIQSINWSFQGADNPSSTSSFVSAVNYRNAGLFDVSITVTTTNGCEYTLVKEEYIQLGESQTLTLSSSKTLGCLSEEIRFIQSTNPVYGSHRWNVAPGIRKNNNKYYADVVYRDTGYHSVEYVLDHNGCMSSASMDSIVRIRGSKAGFISTDNIHCDTVHTVHFTNTSDTTTAGIGSFKWNIYADNTDSLVFSSSNKNINFTVDSLPGIYDVELIATDLLGCSDTLFSNKFIRIEPYNISISPFPLVSCPNSDVVFLNRTRIGTPGIADNFSWTFYGSNGGTVYSTSNVRTPRVSFDSIGKYGFKVVASNSLGCLDSLILMDTIEIVNPSPAVELSDTAICFNDSILLLGTSSPSNAVFQYEWEVTSGNNTVFEQTGDSVYLPLYTPGAYSLKMRHSIVGNGAPNVCKDSIIRSVYANGVKGRVVIDTNSGCSPLTINPRFEIEYNEHAGSIDTNLQYNWTVTPSTNVVIQGATTASPSFTLIDERNYRISVFVSNSAGCSYYDEKGANIRVGVLSRFRPPNSTFCKGQQIKIENLSQGDPSYVSYSLIPPAPAIFDSVDFYTHHLTFDTTGIFKVQQIVSKNNQCADTFLRTYTIIDFKADFYVKDSILQCAPQQAEFRNASTNADSLIWLFGDGDSLYSDTSMVQHIYQENDSFDVSLVATNNYGCRDTVSKQDVFIVVGPKIRYSVQNNIGCEDLELSIINNSNGIDYSFIDYGDGSPVDSGYMLSHTYSVQNGDSMQYFSPQLFVGNTFGCLASRKLDSLVLVFAKPQADILISPDTAICQSSTFSFTNQSVYADSSRWYFDGTLISDKFNDSFSSQLVGEHTLSLVCYNAFGCMDSTSQTITILEVPNIAFDTSFLACQNQVFVKNASLIGSSLSAQYDWQMGETSNVANTQSSAGSAQITYLSGGLKNIFVTANLSNGCVVRDSCEAFVISSDSLPSPSIKYVTVNSAAVVEVYYSSINYTYFNNYRIYKNGNAVDIVDDQTVSVWTDIQNVAAGNSYCFEIESYNSCGVTNGPARAHCAIVLNASSNRHKEIDLNWTAYVGWDSVESYSVYRSVNSEPYLKIADLTANELSYTDTSLCEAVYSYYIEASQYAGLYQSRSNIVSQQSYYIPNSVVPAIRLASVNDFEEIELNWLASNYEYPMRYELRKYENDFNNELEVFQLTDTFLYDANVNCAANSYIYTISEIDQCEVQTATGLVGKTILLKAVYDGGAQLSWTAYEEWADNVDHYDILVLENGVFNIVNSVGAATLSYLDQAIHLENENGQYAYKVRAVSSNGIESYSNIVFAGGQPIVFVPNAFSPNKDGHNEVFKPSMRFTVESREGRPTDFEMSIYNRWGELIYYSTERDAGWDGTYKEADCPQGVYSYQLKTTESSGRSYFDYGTITLIR